MNLKKELVYHFVSLIPKGKAITYGKIGNLFNLSPRLVGQILHQNPNPKIIPCHRVVFRDGTLSKKYAFGGIKSQYQKLKNEGINFLGEKIHPLSLFFWQPNKLLRIYFLLLNRFGFPGPWPWFNEGKPATKEEIIIGSVLTQNTSWRNVEKTMAILRKNNLNNIEAIYQLGKRRLDKLAYLIKSSGFYRLKGQRLFNLVKMIQSSGGITKLKRYPYQRLREILLQVNGVGEETADTTALYAFDKPCFVIDAYTKKFVAKYFQKQFKSYKEYQNFFQSQLPPHLQLYQNYHALLVKWGKENQSL